MPDYSRRIRTLVFLIEANVDEGETLAPHTIRTLREYADALEADTVGVSEKEIWEDSFGSVVKVVHGNDNDGVEDDLSCGQPLPYRGL